MAYQAKRYKPIHKSFFRRLSEAFGKTCLLIGVFYLIVVIAFGVMPGGGTKKPDETALAQFGQYASLETTAYIPVYVLDNGVHCDLALPAVQVIATPSGHYAVDWLRTFSFETKLSPTLLPSALDYPLLPLEDQRRQPPQEQAETAAGQAAPQPEIVSGSRRGERISAALADDVWCVIGWGHKEFYTSTPTWADLRPGPALRALWGGPAVLQLSIYRGPLVAGEYIRPLLLTPNQYIALHDFIQRTVVRDGAGRPAPVPDFVLRTDKKFIEATGRFSGMNTCNTWIAGALQAAGQPAPRWTPFSWFIFYHLPADR